MPRGSASLLVLAGALFSMGIARTAHAAVPAARQPGASTPPVRVLTDEVGRRVSIRGKVHRIVTLSPDLTETIYALGLDNELVGDTDYCDTPPAAKLKPHVGSAREPSLEAVLALHPDLVLASGTINWLQTVQGLTRAGVPVYTAYPRTVRGMLTSFEHIADAVGNAPRGIALAANLRKRLDAVHERLRGSPKVRVLFVEWEDPLMTIGQNTFIADALQWAGAASVIHSKQNWPDIGLEEVLRLEPDYLIFPTGDDESRDARLAALRARPQWAALEPVKLGHVETVSHQIEIPSVELVDVIEKLARDLHPAAFAASNATKSCDGNSGPCAL